MSEVGKVEMTASKQSTGALLNKYQVNGEWLEITPGERFKIRTSVEDTAGTYTMLELLIDPRNGVPMHIHKNEDEHFIVLDGTLHVAIGHKTLDAVAGTAVTVGKGVPHAWCNLADTPLRILVVLSPGHIEGLFKAAAARQSDDELPPLAEKYGVEIIGPALHEGIYSIASPRP
jgi:mannose-6-phosphate isomerase-like protein (cupin superfamily)